MMRMWTGKLVGGNMATPMRWLGQFIASRDLRSMLVSGEIADMDSTRLRTVCEPFESAADAWLQTVEADAWSRMRTVCCRVCARGLNVFADCSRTWISRVCGLFRACPRS